MINLIEKYGNTNGIDKYREVVNMKKFLSNVLVKVYRYGYDIAVSEEMKREKEFLHHGSVNCFEHSVNVACMCVSMGECINRVFKNMVDIKQLVRGALLHDYFLYDWHEYRKTGKKPFRNHGYAHPKIALANAQRDFTVSKKEANIILRHMFPLTPVPPKYIEGFIVTIADKICAVRELWRSSPVEEESFCDKEITGTKTVKLKP